MTLQNLRYIIEIANARSFSKAARTLFLTQSAISAAVKETEEEVGIRIFNRTNRGVTLTIEGEDFLKYCREIVEKADYLANRYQNRTDLQTYFSVSAQHLPFAVRAFREMLRDFDSPAYNMSIRETHTLSVFHDVSTAKSEIGVAAFHDSHFAAIRKSLYTYELSFTEVAQLNIYVFLHKQHPLAGQRSISIEELKDYPFITYDQENFPSQYTEEILFYEILNKTIHVSDRSTKLALIRKSNAFSLGIDLPNSNADSFFRNTANEVYAIPLKEPIEPLHVGFLVRNGHEPGPMAVRYLEYLEKEISLLRQPSQAAAVLHP